MVRDLRNSTPHGLSMNYSIGSPQVINKKKNKIKFTTSGKKILL